jgi:hypothetical protein
MQQMLQSTLKEIRDGEEKSEESGQEKSQEEVSWASTGAGSSGSRHSLPDPPQLTGRDNHGGYLFPSSIRPGHTHVPRPKAILIVD